MSETWDFDHQRAETEWTCRQLAEEQGVQPGVMVNLDLQFVPVDADGADTDGFLRSLRMFGYAGRMVEDEVEVTVEGVAFAPEAIWLHEERTTKIALARGFVPDGWGFWEP